MHVPTQCYLPSNSFFLYLTHAFLLLSPPSIFLLNNQFLSWLMWLKHTETHTSTHTRAQGRWLETGSIPLSVLLKEALTSFLALGQTHSYPSEKREGGRKRERETGHVQGGKKRCRLSGNMLTCSMCVQHPVTSTPWTLSFMWSSRVVFPSFLFFQQ